MKLEAARIHFSGDVFAAVAIDVTFHPRPLGEILPRFRQV